MSCESCLEDHDSGKLYQPDIFSHPCGVCMEERDRENENDDGVCMPVIECLYDEDNNEICVDRCEIEDLAYQGCPQTPGCHEDCPLEVGKLGEDTIWGNGECDTQCAGCAAWQTTLKYDGGDCKERDALIFEGQDFNYKDNFEESE